MRTAQGSDGFRACLVGENSILDRYTPDERLRCVVCNTALIGGQCPQCWAAEYRKLSDAERLDAREAEREHKKVNEYRRDDEIEERMEAR